MSHGAAPPLTGMLALRETSAAAWATQDCSNKKLLEPDLGRLRGTLGRGVFRARLFRALWQLSEGA
eukprot:15461677-Alexandrium_andersonii.AAC.1